MNFFNKIKDRISKNKLSQNEVQDIQDELNEVQDIQDELEYNEMELEKAMRSKLEEFYKEEMKVKFNPIGVTLSEYLKQFKRSKNINIIPILFWSLLLRNSSIKKSVVKELTAFIRDFSNKQYLNLSNEFRNRTLMTYSFDWNRIDMDYLLEDYMTEDEKITVLGLASFHPCGFVREKALDELIKYDEGKTSVFIMIRCCDWVSNIRNKALNSLINMIDIKNFRYIIKNIMFIHKIKERVENSTNNYQYYKYKMDMNEEEFFYKEISTKINNILRSNENLPLIRNILVENTLSKDKYVQEYLLKEIINNDLLPYREIIEILAKVKDQIVCVKCIKLILEKLSDEETINLKEELDNIRGYKSKEEIIIRLYNAGYFNDVEELKKYALSKYYGVRDIARFYMKKLGFNDFTKFYIEHLKYDEEKKSALLGLCDVCKKDNVEILLQYFKNSTSKVQKKILSKIIELSEREPCCDYNIFLEALHSGNKSVIKLSKIYINQNLELFDKEMIFSAYKSEKDEFSKESLAEILCKGSGWTSLFYSLKLIGDIDNIGSNIAGKNIENWIYEKRSYLIKDKDTGKVKHYSLSKMNKELSINMKSLIKQNGHLLQNSTREIIEGLILNYGEV